MKLFFVITIILIFSVLCIVGGIAVNEDANDEDRFLESIRDLIYHRR